MLPSVIRRVLVAQHRADFRKRFDGLLGESYRLGADPYAGDCIVFLKIEEALTAAKKNSLTPLGPEGRQELDRWLKENADTLPVLVKDALLYYNFLLTGLAGDLYPANSYKYHKPMVCGSLAKGS